MPIDVINNTTNVRSERPSEIGKQGTVPLFAIPPVFPEDFLQGGCSIDSASITADGDGKKILYAGDILRRNNTTGLWDLLSGTNAPADNGQTCVMAPHELDCTTQGQSINGVLRSLHVNAGSLTRAIPPFLLGPNKQFTLKYRSNVETY